MKLNSLNNAREGIRYRAKQIIRVMKISVFLLLISFLNVFAENSYSQETRLSINMHEKSVEEVLSKIESQSEFSFLYSNKFVDVNRKVSIKVKNKRIHEILDKLFAETDVEYTVHDKQIILVPKKILKKNEVNDKANNRVQVSDKLEITGIITDEKGEPLPGVNIRIKGGFQGTISDISGNYKISVDNQNAILEFSFIGYLSQEIVVGTNSVINVKLVEDIQGIEEVVVVGYGTQKKINLTGAVDVVSGDDLKNRPAENIGLLLQGVSPNLNIGITKTGGEPGAGQSWNIRGLGTLSGSSSPLILVDGVEMDVNSLNPEAIESVTVLKDAAASAVYGARAPFGVVLITTKKGRKNQKIKLSYNNNFGFAAPVGIPNFESSLVLATAFNQACANTGISPKFPEEQMDRIRGYIDGTYLPEHDTVPPIGFNYMWAGRHQGNANYNWMHEYWKNDAFRQKHDISLEGGGEKTQYFVSLGLYDQDGMYEYGYDSYKRYNFMTNVSSQVTEWLNFHVSTKYSQTQTDYPQGILWLDRQYMLKQMTTFWPTMPKYNYGVDQSNDVYAINNPIIRVMQGSGRDKSVKHDTWLTLGTVIEPITGWVTNISYNYNYSCKRNTSNPIPVPVHFPSGDVGNIGSAISGYSEGVHFDNYSLFNATSALEESFGQHYFKAMVGYEQESAFYSYLSGSRTELITLKVPSISTALGETLLDDNLYHWATQAVFSRVSYNYKEKYLIEFNARYNGSSKFAEDHRWGFFPSVSAGYNISKENFWEKIEPVVSSMKIRGSYGSLGNQNVSSYLFYPNMPIGSNHYWIMGDIRPNYAKEPGIVSSNLTWETVTTFDVGLDAGFLDNRLNTTFDWYNRTTKDMFGPADNLPAVLGTSPDKENNAEMETKGWELSIVWKDRVSSDFNYTASIMIGDSKSKVLKYKNEDGTIDNWYEGKTVGDIWGYTSDGIIQDENEEMPDQSYIYSNWGPGDIKYKDLDGNDSINDGNRTLGNHGDLSIIGNTLPRYNIGVSLGLNWKGIDVSMFWQGLGKRVFFPRYSYQSATFWGFYKDVNHATIFKEGHINYWRPADETNILGPNTNAYYPKPYFSDEDYKNKETQTRYLLNAAYMRLKNLQIGYTIPGKITQKVHLSKLRVYFSGENLLTITSLTKLLDPETSIVSGTQNGGKWGIGNIYPLSRILSFGINTTF